MSCVEVCQVCQCDQCGGVSGPLHPAGGLAVLAARGRPADCPVHTDRGGGGRHQGRPHCCQRGGAMDLQHSHSQVSHCLIVDRQVCHSHQPRALM